MLNCNPKRISKKFEGSHYNGKQFYRPCTKLAPKEADKKKAKLQHLEKNYKESLRVLDLVIASKQANTPQAYPTVPFAATAAPAAVYPFQWTDKVPLIILQRQNEEVSRLRAELLRLPGSPMSETSKASFLNAYLDGLKSGRSTSSALSGSPNVGSSSSPTVRPSARFDNNGPRETQKSAALMNFLRSTESKSDVARFLLAAKAAPVLHRGPLSSLPQRKIAGLSCVTAMDPDRIGAMPVSTSRNQPRSVSIEAEDAARAIARLFDSRADAANLKRTFQQQNSLEDPSHTKRPRFT